MHLEEQKEALRPLYQWVESENKRIGEITLNAESNAKPIFDKTIVTWILKTIATSQNSLKNFCEFITNPKESLTACVIIGNQLLPSYLSRLQAWG